MTATEKQALRLQTFIKKLQQLENAAKRAIPGTSKFKKLIELWMVQMETTKKEVKNLQLQNLYGIQK